MHPLMTTNFSLDSRKESLTDFKGIKPLKTEVDDHLDDIGVSEVKL